MCDIRFIKILDLAIFKFIIGNLAWRNYGQLCCIAAEAETRRRAFELSKIGGVDGIIYEQ